MTNVEFHFDFGSPNAYLAHLAIPQIEQRSGVKFEYIPVLLGGVFKATNNVSPAVSLQGIKNKSEYARIETDRFLAQYGVQGYTPNPHFPVNTLRIMRGAVFAQSQDYYEKYIDVLFRCMWREARKMDEPEVITKSLEESGLPAAEIIAGMDDPAVKQQLIANTEMSVKRGNFGSPTFFIGDEIYFGKDKLRDVEEALLVAKTNR